jgi:Rad3-related DNA helicase
MDPCEMSAVCHAVDCCEDEKSLTELMQRIKRDVAARVDTEAAWTPKQLAQSREWCREHRAWLRREGSMLDGVDHFPAAVSGFKSICSRGVR